MKRNTKMCFVNTAAFLVCLASAWCAALAAGQTTSDLKPRDLAPVTVLEAPKHPAIEIARDGAAKAVIYVADPAGRGNYDPRSYRLGRGGTSALVRMVNEMVDVLSLTAGVRIEVVDQPPAADKAAIVVGSCEESRAAGIDTAAIPPEGYVIKTAPNRVFLVGGTNTVPAGGTGSDNGTAWAIADFLERVVGVRWYWPAEYGGRSIVRQTALTIPPLHYKDQPVSARREVGPTGGSLAGFVKQPFPATMPSGVVPDGEKQLLFGAQYPLMRIGTFVPYRQQNQEVAHGAMAGIAKQATPVIDARFALKDDGTRDYSVLCYSSPETLDFFLNNCEQAWDKGQRLDQAAVTPSSLNIRFPNTPGLICKCPRCKEIGDAARGDDLHHQRVIVTFVKNVAEAIQKRWPDKWVVFNTLTVPPPKGLELPSNVRIWGSFLYSKIGRFGQEPDVKNKVEESLRGWNELIKGHPQVSPYNLLRELSDGSRGPAQFPHLIGDFYRTGRTTVGGGPTDLSIVFWSKEAPTAYVLMRAYWNPEFDVDVVLDEMCRRLFGPAQADARALLTLQCDRWEKTVLNPPLTEHTSIAPECFKQIWPAAAVAEMKTLRDKALEKFGNDAPEAKQAFLYWTWMFDSFAQQAEYIHSGSTNRPPVGVATASTNPPAVTPAEAAVASAFAGNVKTNEKDGAVMVLIPDGSFEMGSTKKNRDAWFKAHPEDQNDVIRSAAVSDEMPPHTVELGAYYLYRTEVTVSQYRKFCQDTGRAMPPEPVVDGAGPWKWQDSHPIVNVTWNDAKAYATWAGADLPTEAEWERAARGGDQRTFPWGEVWPPPQGAGNFADASSNKSARTFGSVMGQSLAFIEAYTDGVLFTAPAGASATNNPTGIADLAGNVREWCADWYDAGYYKNAPKRNPAGPTTGVWRVVRGGSWYDGTAWCLRVANRGDYRYFPIGDRSCVVGFRCVVRVP
jgi:formylglycine-generating enzyme required for sulfatase activity